MTAPRCTSERYLFTTASLINKIVEVVHPPGLARAKPRRDRFRLLKKKIQQELKKEKYVNVWGSPKKGTNDLLFLKDLIEYGKLKTVIDRSYKLDQIRESHVHVEKFHTKGYVAVTIFENWHEFTCPRCWPPDSLLCCLPHVSSCCLLTITCCLLTTAFSVFIYAIFL